MRQLKTKILLLLTLLLIIFGMYLIYCEHYIGGIFTVLCNSFTLYLIYQINKYK